MFEIYFSIELRIFDDLICFLFTWMDCWEDDVMLSLIWKLNHIISILSLKFKVSVITNKSES